MSQVIVGLMMTHRLRRWPSTKPTMTFRVFWAYDDFIFITWQLRRKYASLKVAVRDGSIFIFKYTVFVKLFV